ncbi:MAG: hypothetical protein PHD33_07650 [Atribacterota bacterium]|nr:hypothetical protein [Atribacterota bacterium]
MRYLFFSLGFTIIHTIAYTIAGMLALKISKDLYEEKERLLDFIRDMSDETDRKHVTKWFMPAQLLRGLLMSFALYPILGLLGNISFIFRFIFFSSLMFIYTDFSSAVPFPNNIEGLVYMKSRYQKKNLFWKLYYEMIIYSLLFSILTSWLLFL